MLERTRRSFRLLWSVADQAVFSGVSFAISIAVARHGDPTDFGAFGVAYVVYTVLLGAVEAFTAEALAVRAAGRSAEERHRMLAEATGTAAVAGVIVAVAGVCLLAAGGRAVIAAALLIPAPLLFLQDVWRFSFFISGRGAAALVNDGLWAVLLAGGLAVAVRSGSGTASLVWAWSGAGAVCGVVGAVQARCLPRPDRALRFVREHGRAGARYAGEFLTTYGGAQGVLVSVGVFVGLDGSAGYRGAQLFFGPVQILVNAVRIAALPRFAALWQRGERSRVRRLGGAAAAGLAAIALTWGVIGLLLPTAAGEAILGASWELTRDLLVPMLCIQTAVAASLGPILQLRAAYALQRTFRIRVTGALGAFLLGTAGAAVSGAFAAASGVALGVALTTAALWRGARRALG